METQTKDVERFGQLTRKSNVGPPRAYVVLLGLNFFDLPSLRKTIEKGLPWKAFERLVRNMGIPAESVAVMIDVPRRTLARRKAEGRFKPDESDRLLRAARVFGSALRLFDGNRDAAGEWLTELNMALGGVSPLEFARSDIGAEEVVHLVGRIQYGVYS